MIDFDHRRFRISTIAIFGVLVAAAMRGWASYHVRGVEALTPEETTWFLGNVLAGGVLLPFFLAWIAWLVFRRSSIAANAVFCGLGCGFCLWLWNLAPLVWSKAELFHAGQQSLEWAQQGLSFDFPEAAPDKKASVGKGQHPEGMTSAATPQEGRETRANEARQRFFNLLADKMKAYNTATQALASAGFSRAKGISSKEDITHRRELVVAFAAANKDVANFYAAAETNLRDELKKENLDAAYIDETVHGFHRKASIDLVLKVREYDAELSVQMEGMLDLYEREWRTWRVDDNGRVIFVNPAAVDEFVAAQMAISKIADQQKATQQEIAKNSESIRNQAR